jgi:hypothetical protein
MSQPIFQRLFTTLTYFIVFGATLVFSTATRSVFEVNKLGIFKIALSLMAILYFYDRLLGNKTWFHDYSKNKWINHSILFLWITNILSTIFSKHIIISIYGCYDRWEGLLTYSFYLFLTYVIANVNSPIIIKRIIWAIIIASGLSSLYGIIQSLGMDIVSWSMDPSKRVFGSINNPVHYCAVMAMSLPIIVGQLFYTAEHTVKNHVNKMHLLMILAYYTIISIIIQSINLPERSLLYILSYITILGAPYIVYMVQSIKNNTKQNKINILFTSLLLCTYATYISYSRAAWVGLTAGLGLMFVTSLLTKKTLPKPTFFTIIIGSTLFTAISYLMFVFNMHTTGTLTFTACLLLLCTSAALIQTKKNLSNNIIHSILLIITLFYYHTPISTLLLTILFLGLIFQKKQQQNLITTQILIFLIIWLKIQFIGGSVINGINFLLLILNFLATEPTTSLKNPLSTSPITKWKLITISIIAVVFIAPIGYTTLVQSLQTTDKKESHLIKEANKKINSFNKVAIEGTARTSMWKSAIPWTRDHIILGSGLDTIKYYYPKYRRPEYGKLEGGHNYTPDRLHNEYLNTLSTKGVLGFISLYILFVGGTFIYLLNHIYHHTSSSQYLITGLISGSLVYLGQVLFNFGVVATLIYFFLFMGLSIGLSLNHDND